MRRLRLFIAAAFLAPAALLGCQPEGERAIGEDCLTDDECRSPVDGNETQCRYNTCRVLNGAACVTHDICATDCCISGRCEATELCRNRDAAETDGE